MSCHPAHGHRQASVPPHAIILPVRGGQFQAVPEQMLTILNGFSPLIELVSIDDALLDLTSTEPLLGDPETVARRRRDRAKLDLGS